MRHKRTCQRGFEATPLFAGLSNRNASFRSVHMCSKPILMPNALPPGLGRTRVSGFDLKDRNTAFMAVAVLFLRPCASRQRQEWAPPLLQSP